MRTPLRIALVLVLFFACVAAAHATPKQVVINSPVNGNLSSHPSGHHLSAGWNANWSADISSGAGQAVYARFGAANGALSLQVVDNNSQSCANNGGGGSRVTVRALVDGVVVGEVRYLHLANARSLGPIANGTQIGTVIGGLDRDEACWTGPHVHIEGKNLAGATSCYAPGLGGALNGSSRLGVLGGEWTGGQRAQCPEAAFNVTTPPVDPPPPPPPPDSDSDGVPDAADVCPSYAGSFMSGCPEELAQAGISGRTDFNGDGRADYCRRVGQVNRVQSRVECTISTGNGFGRAAQSGVIDWGYEFGRGWVDFNGDGRSDYCRLVDAAGGGSSLACTLSTGEGFGQTIQSGIVDKGQISGRFWADANGDGRVDFCRRVGQANGADSRVSCILSGASGFGQTIQSGVLDWGFDSGRAWADFNGDGRFDYCRVHGAVNGSSSYASCTLSTGSGFGQTVQSDVLDWGQPIGRTWVDVNGDGRADFCRRVGTNDGVDSRVSCTLSAGTSFGRTIQSEIVPWGYDHGRTWADFNGDGRADYCRLIDAPSGGATSRLACTLSSDTGVGFGQTISSAVIDKGEVTGRAWTDANGDGRVDFCRRVGQGNLVLSRVSCTLSTGTAFGPTIQSGITDWGYEDGRAWTGTTPQPSAPQPTPPRTPTPPDTTTPIAAALPIPSAGARGRQAGPLALRSARIRSAAVVRRGNRVRIGISATPGKAFAGRRVLVQRKIGSRYRTVLATKVQRNGKVRAIITLNRRTGGLRGTRGTHAVAIRLALPKTRTAPGRIGPTRTIRMSAR